MVINEKPNDLFPGPRQGQEEELFGKVNNKGEEKALAIEYRTEGRDEQDEEEED